MKFFTIIALICLLSCQNSSSKKSTSDIENNSALENSERLIKNSKGEIYIAIISEKQGWGTIASDLSKSEVIEINKILPIAVKYMNIEIRKHYDSGQHTWPADGVNLAEYKRQYCPYINKAGEKEVYIFCFCRAETESWKTRSYIVDGGGKCYFRGIINLKTKQFRHFMINAPM